MNFKSFALVAILSSSGIAHSATIEDCDKASAQRVKAMVSSMAIVSEKNGDLICAWKDNWYSYSLSQKDQMIRAVADNDACLLGKLRPIYIYYMGEVVARATPYTGIEVVK